MFANTLGSRGSSDRRESDVLSLHSLSWPGIELRHLTALCAVAEERSFGRAATRLGYTQSAVSQQIAALERAVGHRLLERAQGRGAITLTAAGEIVLEHAGTIARELSLTRAGLERLEHGDRALEVGMHAATGLHLFPDVIERLGPEAASSVRLHEPPSSRRLLDLVARDELDVAAAELPVSGEFAAVELLHEEYVAVVAARSPEAALAPLTAVAAAEHPLLVLREPRGLDELGRYFARAGAVFAPAFEADNPRTLCELAHRGHGIALVPRLAADGAGARVVVELVDAPARRLGLVWRASGSQSRFLTEFVDAARCVFAHPCGLARPQLAKAG